MNNKNDLTGQKFGKWTVLCRAENNQRNATMWKCMCECGKVSDVLGTNLRLGRTHGCKVCNCGKKNKNHGMTHSKIYKTWKNMRQRCFNKNDHSYKNYGGRGITVCDEWRNSFESFYDYVSKLPHFGEVGYSIDRIDNDGNYEPNNVRWATAYEQTHNRIRKEV